MFGCCICAPNLSAAKVPDEYDVKLVYLYNFTKFINWPDEAFANQDSPFSICIFGKSLNGNAVKALEEKKTRNRTIEIVNLTATEDISRCQILFLTKAVNYPAVAKIAKDIKTSTLVVGETAGFARHSGEIGFVIDERNRVRIEVNLDRANEKNISFRAQLLEIARKIYRDGEGL